jgi:predicted GH43/DUF377 family glycosyl hydrolase
VVISIESFVRSKGFAEQFCDAKAASQAELRNFDTVQELPMAPIVTRLPLKLTPDPGRVITRFFGPGDVNRSRGIIDRILAFPEEEIEERLAELERTFGVNHPDLHDVFADHFQQIAAEVAVDSSLSRSRKLFIGACFTMEYAIEAVALFNPSIVPAMIQEGTPPGSIRFLMSLRATGEGHLSSIVFRTGVIDACGDVQVDTPGTYSQTLKATLRDKFHKSAYRRDLNATGVPENAYQPILDRLGDSFTRDQLSQAIELDRQGRESSGLRESTTDSLIAATRVNYQLHLTHAPVGAQGEIVIFPFSDIERHGIEDLRMVRFTDDDGSTIDYGTFTAFNGERVFPQLMEFRGECTIDISLITGDCARNKGMALFPRRIRGKYAMISRIDNENLYYMESDDILAWDQASVIESPKYLWQIMQIGNCGSPIETEAGWLLLTHGVGAMRRYCIGATLLDLDNPCRVIGLTREPLIVPGDDERSGYVPNVVYSCGGLLHNRMLIVPYALSDLSTGMARIDLDELLRSLVDP